MSGGRGRGRGRKAKPSKTEGLALSPLGVAGAEDKMLVAVQPRELLTTPLTALLRIEATIWMSKRGGGSMSIDDFYVMAKSHEWLGINSSVNTDNMVNREGDGADVSNISPIQIPKAVADLSNVVHELINRLSGEERLLFDFMAVSSWDPKVISSSNLYPIYKLDSSTKAKGFRIEILQQLQPTIPSTITTTKSINKLPTRSEVLGVMYHHTCKYLSFEGAESNNNVMIQNWWIHAKNVAQVILDHREFMIATSTKIKNKVQNKPFSKSLVTNGTTDSVASTNEMNQNADKKMTLEERVRARSLLNPANAKKKTQQRSKAGVSPHQYESKAILELANALRSYSNSRGSVSSGGNSALDRLKLKSAASGSGLSSRTAKNVARLTVSDLIKDARITWNSVVNESIEQRDTSGGNKARPRGGGTIVAIDLSRVLFQLRLKMISKKDISDKRQMENELLGLLEKLAELVPTWINLHKAPTLLTGGTSKKSDSSASTNQPNGKQKFNIRQSIIVIRNGAVDYNNDVRAKLGGQVYNSNVDTTTNISNNQKKVQVSNGKRSFQDMKGKSQNIGVADAIVPPTFQQLYGKALDEKPKKKR